MPHPALSFCLLGAASLLAGCDTLGIETASQLNAKKEAEARAIGSACRHAVRSIEDCFGSNPRAGKAAVFAGWKDMDQYMRDNEIVGMPSPAGASRSSTAENLEPGSAQDGEAPDRRSRRS